MDTFGQFCGIQRNSNLESRESLSEIQGYWYRKCRNIAKVCLWRWNIVLK